MSNLRPGRIYTVWEGRDYYWIKTDGTNTFQVTQNEAEASQFDFVPNNKGDGAVETRYLIFGTEQKVYAVSNSELPPQREEESVYGTHEISTSKKYNFEWIISNEGDQADPVTIKATRPELNGFVWTLTVDDNKPDEGYKYVVLRRQLPGPPQSFYIK